MVTEKFGETSRGCFSSKRALKERNSFQDQSKHCIGLTCNNLAKAINSATPSSLISMCQKAKSVMADFIKEKPSWSPMAVVGEINLWTSWIRSKIAPKDLLGIWMIAYNKVLCEYAVHYFAVHKLPLKLSPTEFNRCFLISQGKQLHHQWHISTMQIQLRNPLQQDTFPNVLLWQQMILRWTHQIFTTSS